MKTVKFLITLSLVVGLSVSAIAQTRDHGNMDKNQTSARTESFKVWGICGMCKARIEKTVKAEGATNASWDSEKQLLTVTYDPSISSIEELSKKLASVGHDTEKFKAPDDIYAKLPGCCRYERGK